MAKKGISEERAKAAARVKRTEAYAEKVRLMFAQTVNNILALNKTIPTLDEGVMYSFDGDSMRMQKKVEAALRQLHSAATMAIRRGITLEWDLANQEADKLINSVFGKRIMESPEFNGWMDRNSAARDAFLNRSERGLNLSDRIWKSVKQLREEMEVAMTVAIGEGDSASSMSRKVREYLNDPDLMFRRFRYKKGEKDIIDPETGEIIGKQPVYGLKWKKRVRDEQTGKIKFIDYDRDSYKTGAGVYKSSAKNAMRVARTETNIAYRHADHERWQGMDFVLGQHIEVSRSHPKPDICDKLEGDYPKDFVFEGWHPQCFCVCTPILMDTSEMAKVTEAFLQGKSYTPKGKQITDYPQGFKDWVTENQGKIVSSHDVGRDPYFIRSNYQVIDDILHPDRVKKLTPLEIAEKRHEMRTPEEIDQITKKAMFRDKSIKTAQRYLDEFRDVDGADISALQDAYEHARWDDVRSEALKLAQMKRGIIEDGIAAINKGKDFGEVDVAQLQSILKAKDSSLKALQSAITSAKEQIKMMEVFEQSISDLIPDAHMWHKQFTMSELQKAHSAIETGLAKINGKSLAEQKKMLEKEIHYVEDPTFLKPHTQYPTWKVVQDAYITKLKDVEWEMKIAPIKAQMAVVESWSANHPQSKNVANLLLDYKLAVSTKADISTIQAKATLVYSEYQKRLKEQAKRDAKKGAIVFNEFTEEKITSLLDKFDKNTIKGMDNQLRPIAKEVWENLSAEERIVLTKYTQTYSYLNERLRGLTYYGDRTQDEYDNDMPLLTGALNKFKTKKDMVVRRGTDSYYINELGKDLSMVQVGDEFTDGGFLSTAAHRTKGFFRSYNLVILVPKGARGAFAEPFSHYTDSGKFDWESDSVWDGQSDETIQNEFEWIGQRGSRFKVIKVEGRNIFLQMIGQLR